CVWTEPRGSHFLAAYTARVRISVRAGDIVIVREGCGNGEGKASTPAPPHEIALKTAETDATKRALATFGNSFGLALYDSEQSGVRKQRRAPEMHSGPWVLRSASGLSVSSHDTPTAFIVALRQAMIE